MAFGILVLGMIMGLVAAVAVIPSDAGLFLAGASYVAFGVLTCMSVVLFAMFSDARGEDREFD